MANISATMSIGLVDNVSKPARTVAQALKEAERAAEQVAKGLQGTGATDRLSASLSKLKANAKDIETVATAWRDYSKSAGLAASSADWTKAQTAGVRQWEAQTISALRAVKSEQIAFNRSLSGAGGVSPMVTGMSSFGAGGIARIKAAAEGQKLAAGMSTAGTIAAAEAAAIAEARSAKTRGSVTARPARGDKEGAGGWSAGALMGGAWAGGMGTMAAGYGAYAVAKHAVRAGAAYQHETIALENAGRSLSEMREIEERAREVAKQVPTSSLTGNLKVVNETTGAFGDLNHALENLGFMAKAASVLKNAAGDKIHEDAGEIGNKFTRFFEMRGTAGNSELFQKEAGAMVPPMVFSGGNFNPGEMLSFGQQAKSSLQNYDLRFMSRILPSLITEIGGERAGTAANAFTNVILGKVRDKVQTKAWQKYGLVDPKQVIEGKGGALSWKAGAVKGTDKALSNPLDWIEETQLPAMKAKGVDIDNALELTKAFNELYRNSNANLMANLVGQLRNRQRLHKDERLTDQAGSLDQIYNRNVTSDPTVAVTKFSAAWENLGASITMALPIAEGINSLAELIAGASEKLKPAADAAKAGADLAKNIIDNSPLAKAEREAREQAAKEGRKPTVGEIGARAWENIKQSWEPSQAGGAPDYAAADWRRGRYMRRQSSAVPTFASRSIGFAGAPSAPDMGVRGGMAAGGLPAIFQMQAWKPTLDISGLQADAAKGENLGDQMKEKLSFTAIPMVDVANFERAEQAAEKVRTAAEQLNLTVTPNVDSSSIDAASSKLDAFLAKLAKAEGRAASLGSHVDASNHRLAGLFGKVSRGNFTASGVQGE
jgi:hypothetical protein